MNGMRDALLRMVRAWTRSNKVMEACRKAEMDCHILFRVCGEIEEAICILVGESEMDLEETITHTALSAPYLTEERRIAMLMAKYRESHPELPSPQFMDRDESPEETGLYAGYRPRRAVRHGYA